MGSHENYDEKQVLSLDYLDEDVGDIHRKKEVRRMIEKKLDEKRLRKDLEDDLYDENEFNWDDFE